MPKSKHTEGVAVELDTGTSIGAHLLVAADGRRSALRKSAGIKTIGWAYPQVGIIATIAHEKPHEGVAIQHFLPAGPFAILPLKENRSSIVWTDATGKFKIKARLLRTTAEEVTLQGIDGRSFKIPLQRLSASDRKYVRNKKSK